MLISDDHRTMWVETTNKINHHAGFVPTLPRLVAVFPCKSGGLEKTFPFCLQLAFIGELLVLGSVAVIIYQLSLIMYKLSCIV